MSPSTARAPSEPIGGAPSAWRALALAALGALVFAHAGLAFSTGVALGPGYGAHLTIPLPLVAAAALHDTLLLFAGLGAAALAAWAARATPATREARETRPAAAAAIRSAVVAAGFGLLAGLGANEALGLEGLAGWLPVLAIGALAYAALFATRPDSAGFLAALVVGSVGVQTCRMLAPSPGLVFGSAAASLLATLAAVRVTRAVSTRAGSVLHGSLLAISGAAIWLAFFAYAPTRAAAPELDAGIERPPPHAGAASVVLVVLDTLRADAFDPDPDGDTPALATLAGESRVARRAVSTSNWTLPAHGSLFTGSYPTTHGAHFLGAESARQSQVEAGRLATENVTLAELLRGAGYQTFGVVANHAYLHADTGIHQGFDVWDDRFTAGWQRPRPLARDVRALPGLASLGEVLGSLTGFEEARRQYLSKSYRLGPDVTLAGLALLDGRDTSRPFFLFLNYMDAHAPYIPQAPTRARLGDALRPAWLGSHDGLGGVDPAGPGGEEVMRGTRDLTLAEEQHLRSAYRGEVIDLDEAIGALLGALRERGLYDDTWIVVTSDHGEFLGEHRLLGHSSQLYEEAIAVPFLIKAPHSARRDPIEGVVQPVDLLPTLAQRLGLPLPERVEGSDVDAIGERPAVAEQYAYPKLVRAYGRRFAGDRRALIAGTDKLLWFTTRPPSLFDLQTDPRETDDRRRSDPLRARRLGVALEEWVSERSPIATPAPPAELSPEERRRLESLGYL